jgi:predicted cupin superfamily sugar epimerase
MHGPARDSAADDIVRLLGLAPHPEGGHYREMFRDVAPGGPEGVQGRAHSTAIYFLLRAGEVSRWHRVDAAEVWHWYAGAPLLLTVADAAGRREARLGTDLAAGERPQAVVPAHAWQQARSLGAWTLVGCTVAPGFELAGFGLAPPWVEPGG